MSKAVVTTNHLRNTKKIICSFCHGSGKDPFGQLYPGSTCQVCKGKRQIYVLAPYKWCTYCHGSGVEFSTQNTCTACLGRGIISLGKERSKKKKIICTSCQGTGMDLESDLPCASCAGQGIL